MEPNINLDYPLLEGGDDSPTFYHKTVICWKLSIRTLQVLGGAVPVLLLDIVVSLTNMSSLMEVTNNGQVCNDHDLSNDGPLLEEVAAI